MVHYQRYQQWKKGIQHQIEEDEESNQAIVMECDSSVYYKRTRPKLLSFLFLCLLSCSFIFAPYFLGPYSFPFLNSIREENHGVAENTDSSAPLCPSVPDGTICCDRSGFRFDICFMKGDVRTHSATSTIILYSSRNMSRLSEYAPSMARGEAEEEDELSHEKIKPYTRKWETSIMDTVQELDLIVKRENAAVHHQCDVQHDVPAVFFSTGGYTGNVYHEFNDGILPLYITSQHLKKKVVFVILEYHNWWLTKYGDVLSHLSDYPVVDYSGDHRTHCFPEAIVGLKIHDELNVNPSMMEGNKNIVDFRNVLDRAYRRRIRSLIKEEEREATEKQSSSPSSRMSLHPGKTEKHEDQPQRPKLVLLSRTGARAITNEKLLTKMAEEIGFKVQLLVPDRTTELAKIYRILNSSDVMVGVHGAAMTHFLFMRPGSVFMQVIPLGTAWAADTYYGEPARKLGLKYIAYEIQPRESSLYEKYKKDDPVITNPNSVTKKGWQYTKKIYLDGQNVTLDLRRFRKQLDRAYYYSIAKRSSHVRAHVRHQWQ